MERPNGCRYYLTVENVRGCGLSAELVFHERCRPDLCRAAVRRINACMSALEGIDDPAAWVAEAKRRMEAK
jgi:hypothetical protein